MDLTEYEAWDCFDLDPEAPHVIANLADHRFGGDMAAALGHVFCRGVAHTPDAELPSSLQEAGPVFRSGLTHTALVNPDTDFQGIYGEHDIVPEPFTTSVPTTAGPPITFGRHFTPQRIIKTDYYQLLDPEETQVHDRDTFVEALADIRQLADIEDTSCLYALRQDDTNAAGRGLRGFAAALPRDPAPPLRRRSWLWDRIQEPSEDATFACVLKLRGNRIVIRRTYRGATQEIAIDRVAMPVVHDAKGGTDAALAIVENLLPDVTDLEQRVLDVDSRLPATTSERARLNTRSAMRQRGPIERAKQFRLAEPDRTTITEFVDRVQVSNPFGPQGQWDPSAFRVEPEPASLLAAPDKLVLHLRDHAPVRQLAGYTYTIHDIGAQRIAGVANLTVMGTWVDDDGC